MTTNNVMMIILVAESFLGTILIGIPWFRSWGFKKNGIYTGGNLGDSEEESGLLFSEVGGYGGLMGQV